MSLRALLADHRRYLDQIDRLHVKYASRRRLYELKQAGVSLASVSLHRRRIARLLAREVGRGSYELQPARTRWLTVDRKQRLLYVFCLTDLIVHGVVAAMINERIEPELSPHLYSYRRGRDWWQAVADFARYVRGHRRGLPDPKTRGLYVLRRDIYKYTDSIPVTDRSRLWSQLRRVLSIEPASSGLPQRYWALVQSVVRPETCSQEGFVYSNIRGVPTGSPISTALFNLYLTPLDQALDRVPGGFYARYCDDFMFAHPDPDVVRSAAGRIDTLLAELGLRTNQEKDRNLYFTGAGRLSVAWPEARGTTQIPFLGCEVAFDATIALDKKKVRRLLSDVRLRARRTLKAWQNGEPQVAGPVVCAAINQALNPASPCCQKSALLLRRAVTNRRQLRQIDYRIARIVARVLTGEPGVRAFRRVGYRRMRDQWNLVSLVHSRNTLAARR